MFLFCSFFVYFLIILVCKKKVSRDIIYKLPFVVVCAFIISYFFAYFTWFNNSFQYNDLLQSKIFWTSDFLFSTVIAFFTVNCKILIKKENKKKTFFSCLIFLFFFLINIIALFLFTGCKWFNSVYGFSFRLLMDTAAMPVKGTGLSVLGEVGNGLLPLAISFLVLSFFINYFIWLKNKPYLLVEFRNRKINLNIGKYVKILSILCTLFSCIQTAIFLEKGLHIKEYFNTVPTTLYEDYYVAPDTVNIRSPEKKKNLIYIYLESMETTYPQELIPNLVKLSEENISFSNTEGWGGAENLTGAGWTMGALFTSSSGIPFAFPVEGNSMGGFSKFASGVTTLGDILNENGYSNEFLCGSDGDFAGRKRFFEQHGNYYVFDYYTAIEKKYIPEDYYAWWGFEDSILFEIAKDELLRLASESSPFNFTMLTVDPHHVHGYYCSKCESNYSENLANVLACQDKQIADFVNWCKEQSFYEDSIIVITGDHPRMDTDLISNYKSSERHVYNCIINSSFSNQRTKNRQFGIMDMMPTILNLLSFEYDGDRIGLGTNLFSDTPTLCEELGTEYLNSEMSKWSEFYLKTFP